MLDIKEKIVAVDIGGSKIDILYLSKDKQEYIKLNFGLKHKDLSYDKFFSRLNKLSKYLKDNSYIYIFGIAGLDSDEDRNFWRRLLDNIVKGRYFLYHDVKSALYTATLGYPGIIVIAGTGCNVYGEYNGKYAYSGNWGWRYGDDFSGYRIGRDFINYILKMYDGRIEKSTLYYDFLNFIGIDEDELIPWIYKLDVESIASLVYFICPYYPYESIVKSIFKDVFRELIKSIKSVLRRLDANLKIHYTGGLFNCKYFKALFKKILKYNSLELGTYVKYPIIGTVLLGLKNLGYDIETVKAVKLSLENYISKKSII